MSIQFEAFYMFLLAIVYRYRSWVGVVSLHFLASHFYFRTSFLKRADGATSLLAYAPCERWWGG